MTVRKMEKPDIDEVLVRWNQVYVWDTRDAGPFDRTIFGDPNYEPGGTLVACDGDTITGFVSCVYREGPKGRDGKGTEQNIANAYLKGVFYDDEETGRELLGRAEAFVRAGGKSLIRVVVYGGGAYFFPGIDLRYPEVISFFERAGYEQTQVARDVGLDLEDYTPGEGPYQKAQWERMRNEGIEVVQYRPELLPQMVPFVERVQLPQWFGEGWERGWQKPRNTVVAVRGDEILGFSSYSPAVPPETIGGFGSIGTLPEERGKGIGTCMMDVCMARLKEAGTKRTIAKWANTPFYFKSGWEVSREFAVFEKRI